MEVITKLAHSRKFWIAVAGVVQSIVFALNPAFPKELWQSIDALLIVLIASIAYEDGAQKSA